MARLIGYWITTVLLAFVYLTGGAVDIAQPEQVVAGAAKVGYPLHFFTLLGCWKLIGAVVLLVPALPRAKEWAYAGISINLTAASITHVMVHDEIADVITPLVILTFAIASWALRPASRKLAGSWL